MRLRINVWLMRIRPEVPIGFLLRVSLEESHLNMSRPAITKSPYKGRRGLARIWNAVFYSLDGLSAAFRHEDAFRQEVLLALVLIPIAIHMPASGPGKAMMVGSVMLVLIVELLNSGIEALTDRVSLEDHMLSKRAKDMGSAAVMLALINVPAVWLLVLL
jgi:diacylglycerol kinase (ATP)